MTLSYQICELSEIAAIEKRVFLGVWKCLVLLHVLSLDEEDWISVVVVQRSHINILASVARGKYLNRFENLRNCKASLRVIRVH